MVLVTTPSELHVLSTRTVSAPLSVPSTKTVVAIDANVFFDLFWPGRPKGEISGALTEPWLDEIVELALTPEIYNDIDRANIAAAMEDPDFKAKDAMKRQEILLLYQKAVEADPRDTTTLADASIVDELQARAATAADD